MPNPATNWASLRYSMVSANAEFTLYNLLNEVQESFTINGNQNQFDFDTSKLANGV